MTSSKRKPNNTPTRAHQKVADRFKETHGAVTAEFAVALPAIVLIVGIAINIAAVGIQQIRLQESAAVAARQLARGEDTSHINSAVTTMAGAEVSVSTSTSGQWASVELSRPAPGPLGWLNISQLTADAQAPNQWVVEP